MFSDTCYTLRVLLVDDLILTTELWILLEKRLKEHAAKESNKGFPTSDDYFDEDFSYDEDNFYGIIKCNNESSSNWWQKTVFEASEGRAIAALTSTKIVRFTLDRRYFVLSNLSIARSLMAYLPCGRKWAVMPTRAIDNGNKESFLLDVKIPSDDAEYLEQVFQDSRLPWVFEDVKFDIMDEDEDEWEDEDMDDFIIVKSEPMSDCQYLDQFQEASDKLGPELSKSEIEPPSNNTEIQPPFRLPPPSSPSEIDSSTNTLSTNQLPPPAIIPISSTAVTASSTSSTLIPAAKSISATATMLTSLTTATTSSLTAPSIPPKETSTTLNTVEPKTAKDSPRLESMNKSSTIKSSLSTDITARKIKNKRFSCPPCRASWDDYPPLKPLCFRAKTENKAVNETLQQKREQLHPNPRKRRLSDCGVCSKNKTLENVGTEENSETFSKQNLKNDKKKMFSVELLKQSAASTSPAAYWSQLTFRKSKAAFPSGAKKEVKEEYQKTSSKMEALASEWDEIDEPTESPPPFSSSLLSKRRKMMQSEPQECKGVANSAENIKSEPPPPPAPTALTTCTTAGTVKTRRSSKSVSTTVGVRATKTEDKLTFLFYTIDRYKLFFKNLLDKTNEDYDPLDCRAKVSRLIWRLISGELDTPSFVSQVSRTLSLRGHHLRVPGNFKDGLGLIRLMYKQHGTVQIEGLLHFSKAWYNKFDRQKTEQNLRRL